MGPSTLVGGSGGEYLDLHPSFANFLPGLPETLFQGSCSVVMLGRQIADFALEFSQVRTSDDVRLGLEGQGIMEAGEPGTLMGLSEAKVKGWDRDIFPDFFGESLVDFGGGYQLHSDPVLGYSGMVLGLLV